MTLDQICDWLTEHFDAYAGPYRDDPSGRNRLVKMTFGQLERLRAVPPDQADQAEEVFLDFLDLLREDPLIGPCLDRDILRFLAESTRVSDPRDSTNQQRKMERVMVFIANEFIKYDAPKLGATPAPQRPEPATETTS